MKISKIIEQIKQNKKDIEFMPTGFKKLDEFLDGGFMRKELVVLGGYTGIGKSFFATSIFYNIAKMGFKSSYISLEISNSMIASRIVGAISNIKPTRLIAGFLTKEENDKRIESEAEAESYNKMMDFHDDLYEFKKIKDYIVTSKAEFIIIDFIQNVFSNQSEEYNRLSFLALEFQKLAKGTSSVIVLLSQLSNEAAKKGYMEYKGSGGIITVCDLGFFMTREKIEENQSTNMFKIELKKNRRGLSGTSYEF